MSIFVLFVLLSRIDHNYSFLIAGGAGVGKSFLIKVTAKYVEQILRLPGDHPNRPKVILLGPTGMAASLIGKNNYLCIFH